MPARKPPSTRPAGGPPSLDAAGPEVRVEITGLAPGGDAVGRQLGGDTDGRITFVPLAAPGEIVRAQLVRQKSRVAWGELLEIERPSQARVTPPCPLFGRCGGCQWQHVDDRIQRSSKGDIVARALGINLTEASPVGPSYGYRERARFTVGFGGVGFHARRSHEIVDVPACPLLTPALNAALPEARERAATLGPGDEVLLLAGADEVVGEAQGRGFSVRDGRSEDREIGDAAAWPDVAEPGSPPLRVPPRGFAQVGRAGNAALVAAVMDAVGPHPGRVLELYAGSGNFTRHLLGRASAVIASDSDAGAVARGRLNAPAADWRVAATLGTSVLPIDTVLVDPPREGLDERSLALAAAGRRLVYVSCDPQTLSRDLGRLLPRGLRLEGAVALDLMPQTDHVEVVALFTRR